MLEALGPVNPSLPHTIITIAKQPTVLPWLRRVPLAVGTYVVNGDVRMYLADRLGRRLAAAGVLKATYVDPRSKVTAAVTSHFIAPVINVAATGAQVVEAQEALNVMSIINSSHAIAELEPDSEVVEGAAVPATAEAAAETFTVTDLTITTSGFSQVEPLPAPVDAVTTTTEHDPLVTYVTVPTEQVAMPTVEQPVLTVTEVSATEVPPVVTEVPAVATEAPIETATTSTDEPKKRRRRKAADAGETPST